MKLLNIKFRFTGPGLTFLLLLGFYSCKIDDLVDPNNPSVESIEADASIDEMNNLVTGMEAGMRLFLDTYLDDCGVIGREYYRFSGSDPRFTSDLLGKGSSTLDNNAFYGVNPWAARWAVVRNGWILRHAVENTSAPVTDEEKNGYLGYAKTIQAYQMLLNSNMTYKNPQGCIRIDVENPDELGPFVSYSDAIHAIKALLDDAADNLDNAGDAFIFALSPGFDGFNTPATFREFNRALAARVDLYDGNFAGVLTDLGESFLDLAGPMGTGVYHVYSTGPGDILNDAFVPLNSSPGGNARCAQPSFVTDAELGDLRLNKVSLRDVTAFVDDLSSDYDVWVYQSNTAPVCIIRNEELILMYAEANAQQGNTADAVSAINTIRTIAGGLTAYSGGTSTDELITEILNQRRYSLFAEGFRWTDMNRYDLLDQLPIDRPGDDVWAFFPIPYNEGQ